MTRTQDSSGEKPSGNGISIFVWPVNGLKKVFADTTPPDDRLKLAPIELSAAAGECEVAQIAVHAIGGQVMLHAPNLSLLRCGSHKIPLDHMSCRFVELVPVRFNSQDVPPSEQVRAAPAYFPDPLCGEDHMHLPEAQTRAIWLRVEVPRDAVPGDYAGSVEVVSSAGNFCMPVKLTVWPVVLPEKIDFSMTLWVWPFIIAKYHGVRLYSKDFWPLLERYAAEMAAHRQDTIFTPIVGPDALIDVIKTESGGYRFDFSNFDRWVQIFLDAGFHRIEGAHIYDDSIRFVRIRDEASGLIQTIKKDGTAKDFVVDDAYMEMVKALFTSLRDHLRKRGWADRYVQHIFDEPFEGEITVYVDLARTLRDIWPEVKFIDAADSDPALFEVIDILVPLIDHRTIYKDSEKFTRDGKMLWSYTANFPRGAYPGTYLDLDLIKVRILPWIMWRYGVTGFLYYALGYWEVQFAVERHRFDPYSGDLDDSIILYNPWLDPAQNATWRCPPGSWGFCYPPRDAFSQDPRILTPHLVENFNVWREGGQSLKMHEAPLADRMKTLTGPVVSIRWEQMREGIEDYGLLCVLRDEIAQADPDVAQEVQQILDNLILSIAPDWIHYTRNPEEIDRARQVIVDQIVRLRQR